MKENKYICPECGTEMDENYNKPFLLLYCPKCGCKIATTKWENIDLDETSYELILDKIESPTTDIIKLISKISGKNFICTRNDLINGDVSFKALAVEIREKKNIFDSKKIKYHIIPDFPY